MREADRAVVVAQHELHAGRVGAREHLGRVAQVLGDAFGEAEPGAHGGGEMLREVDARHVEGALLDHLRDAFVVELVAVVDDVDPEVERHPEGVAVDDVGADHDAAGVRRLDHRGELVAGQLGAVTRGAACRGRRSGRP